MKYTFCLFLIFPSLVFSQGWEKSYEAGMGYSVQQTSDEGYIITGWTDPENSSFSDVYLIKTNEHGDTLWTKTFGYNLQDLGRSVHQTFDEGYIITGYADLSSNYRYDIYLIKTSSIGDTLWTKTFGGDYRDFGNSVKQTSDGGFIICGGTQTEAPYYAYDVYLIKANDLGDTLWTKKYGSNNYDIGWSIQQTVDGGYIICGEYGISYDNSDTYVIKTDVNGDTLWTKYYGGKNEDKGFSIQQTVDGGYIICGYTKLSTYNNDIYLIKTDSYGNSVWEKTYGGPYDDYGYSVQQTVDGGYIVTGSTQSNSEFDDVYLIKTDENGDTLWTRTYGGDYDDIGTSVQQTTDGGYIITGRTNIDLENYLYLIKTDNNGIVSIIEIINPITDKKIIKILDFSGREISEKEWNIPYIEIYYDGTSQKKMIIK